MSIPPSLCQSLLCRLRFPFPLISEFRALIIKSMLVHVYHDMKGFNLHITFGDWAVCTWLIGLLASESDLLLRYLACDPLSMYSWPIISLCDLFNFTAGVISNHVYQSSSSSFQWLHIFASTVWRFIPRPRKRRLAKWNNSSSWISSCELVNFYTSAASTQRQPHITDGKFSIHSQLRGRIYKWVGIKEIGRTCSSGSTLERWYSISVKPSHFIYSRDNDWWCGSGMHWCKESRTG